jgi:hypothetical protein
MLKSTVWFITWNCNNFCPYCWERQRQKRGEFTPEPFLDYQLWVDAWNKLKPAVLDITGGEPFMQPNFLEMLEALSEEMKIAITTNLTFDITQFVQRITCKKVFSITASLHPTSPMNNDVFLGKIFLLMNRGFKVTVNFVAYPEQMFLTDTYRNVFTKNGINFHVDPYSQTPFFPFNYTEQEKKYLGFFIASDRQNALTDEVRPVKCSAGLDHLTVYPDGTAYRCINDSILKAAPIGRIFDIDFKLNTEFKPCVDYNKCAGCNRDKVEVKDDVNQVALSVSSVQDGNKS